MRYLINKSASQNEPLNTLPTIGGRGSAITFLSEAQNTDTHMQWLRDNVMSRLFEDTQKTRKLLQVYQNGDFLNGEPLQLLPGETLIVMDKDILADLGDADIKMDELNSLSAAQIPTTIAGAKTTIAERMMQEHHTRRTQFTTR